MSRLHKMWNIIVGWCSRVYTYLSNNIFGFPTPHCTNMQPVRVEAPISRNTRFQAAKRAVLFKEKVELPTIHNQSISMTETSSLGDDFVLL